MFMFILGTLSQKFSIIFSCSSILRFFEISGGKLILGKKTKLVDVNYLKMFHIEEYEIHVAFAFVDQCRRECENSLQEKIVMIHNSYKKYFREQKKNWKMRDTFFCSEGRKKKVLSKNLTLENLTLDCIQTKDGKLALRRNFSLKFLLNF